MLKFRINGITSVTELIYIEQLSFIRYVNCKIVIYLRYGYEIRPKNAYLCFIWCQYMFRISNYVSTYQGFLSQILI